MEPEKWISPRADKAILLIAKVALFDEIIDLHLDGYCTFDEAIDQYKTDLAELEAS